MEVNAEKLDAILHKIPLLIKELQEVEKHIIAVRQELLTAIEDDDEKST